MKLITVLVTVLCAVLLACAPPTPSDPAEFITLNKQHEIQLLGSWTLVQLKDGHTPAPQEKKTLVFQNDGTMKMDLWEHELTYKYAVMPDPDHLRLTWVSSTNPNDTPGGVIVQELVIGTDNLMLDGDKYIRIALASGATLTPAPTAQLTPLPTDSTLQPIETQLGASVILQVHQTAIVTDSPEKFGITLFAIAGDSRCPATVTCVQAGEARVQITFQENGIVHPPILELSSSPAGNANVLRIENYQVTLTDVQPERTTTDPIPADRYSFTFVITRAEATPTPAASITPVTLQTEHLDQTFTIAIGGVVEIPEAQLQISLTTRLEDSRCPRSVQCVQAGRALLQFWMERNNQAGSFALSTMPPDARTHAYFQNYVLELQEVQPYPEKPDEPIDPQAYRATVVVKQGTPPTSGVHKNEAFVLKIGQTAQIADESVSVKFVGVKQDSRCPTRVTCVTRGNAQVEAVLTLPDGTTQTFLLNTEAQLGNQRIPDAGSYGMELIALTPYPRAEFADKELTPQEYEATFVVRKFA